MKTCCVCHEELPESEFNKNKTRKDGLSTLCRACSRARSKRFYQENTESQKQYITLRRQKRKEESIPKILEILAGGCSSCSEKDIRCLDFHHVENKKKSVMVLLREGYGWEAIKEEIDKCIVLCSNCHRKLTSESNGCWKNEQVLGMV